MARKGTARQNISFLPTRRHVYEVRNGFRAAAKNSFTSLDFHLLLFNIYFTSTCVCQIVELLGTSTRIKCNTDLPLPPTLPQDSITAMSSS